MKPGATTRSARVDLPCRRGVRQPSDGDDPVAANADVAGEPRIARAVDDAAVANHQVV